MNKDKTCECCPERRPAILLVYEDFSPETKQWLCWQCFGEHEDHVTVVDYINADEQFNALHQDTAYWQHIKEQSHQ